MNLLFKVEQWRMNKKTCETPWSQLNAQGDGLTVDGLDTSADMLAILPQWHQAEQLIEEARMMILARPGSGGGDIIARGSSHTPRGVPRAWFS